jgi:membrane-associated phospholipid phosphatase
MNKYLSTLGYIGPNSLLALILCVFAYQHIKNPYMYVAVIAWQFLSHLINISIKNTLRSPRPDSEKDPKFSNLKPTFANFITVHRNYGMPSGHAQAVISEVTFIALYFRNPILTAIAAAQACLTLWQRYTTRRHSVKQLLAGSIVGFLIGSLFYVVFKKNIPDKDLITSL